MNKQDWIILRLTMQIEVLEKGLDGDAIKAAKFLIKKHGNKKIEKCMNEIKNDAEYKKYCFFKIAENYLISKGVINV
jgi:hypothetical protein